MDALSRIVAPVRVYEAPRIHYHDRTLTVLTEAGVVMYGLFPRLLLQPSAAATYPSLQVPICEVRSFVARPRILYFLRGEEGTVFTMVRDTQRPWTTRGVPPRPLALTEPVTWLGQSGTMVTARGRAYECPVTADDDAYLSPRHIPFSEPVQEVSSALIRHSRVYIGLTARGTLVSALQELCYVPSTPSRRVRELHGDSWYCYALLADGTVTRASPAASGPWRPPTPHPARDQWFAVPLLDTPGNDNALPAPTAPGNEWSRLQLAPPEEPGTAAVVYYSEYDRMLVEQLRIRCVL